VTWLTESRHLTMVLNRATLILNVLYFQGSDVTMSTDRLRVVVALVAVFVVVPVVVGQAQAISVLVDGQRLITSAPPLESGGRIMVGMRDIFERLGAEVKWNAANQQITATRGMRTIVLWIGQPYSTVDGAMLPLDVPPQLINGSTYVPVRFPSEALGANVTWMSATRTVMISTASMPALDDTTPPDLPPPSAAPTTANGIFRQVISAAPPAIIVAPYDGSAVAMHPLTPTAIIQRGAAEAPALHLIELTDILPGDDVTLELNDEGQAVRVEARYLSKAVVFQAVAANKLLAQDGSLYQLSSDVTLTRTEAGPNGNRQGGAPGKAAVGQVRPGGPEGGGHDRQGAGGKGLVRFQPRQQEHGGEHQTPANTQQTRQQPSQQPQGEIGQQAPQHPGNLG